MPYQDRQSIALLRERSLADVSGLQKATHLVGDDFVVLLECKMAGIENVVIDVFNIPPVAFRAGDREKGVIYKN